jgi:hypothetical protein
MTDELVMCLRIKGFGKPEAVGEALSLSVEQVKTFLGRLVEERLAEETRAGHRLTPAGRTKADAAFQLERASTDQNLIAHKYERFIPINDAFKQLVTRWQLRSIDGRQVRNDHTDEDYDKSVLAGLASIHDDACALIDALANHVARVRSYRIRLSNAMANIRAGDSRYVTAHPTATVITLCGSSCIKTLSASLARPVKKRRLRAALFSDAHDGCSSRSKGIYDGSFLQFRRRELGAVNRGERRGSLAD